ncbi:unnamed protein product [Rhizophagus irregularis]|uniref:Uncharacterized protein n=1 Tax=Rhizophagus irregularis TaxID=588596 RepID=A0A916E182_9GLOM|nr:unnamed protein product [Rhizophagus irregularis]
MISPCEKQDIKHVGFSQWTMNLGKDLTVSDLEAKIKTDRPDLEEINIELYRQDFFQENNVLINTVNSDKPEKRQGVWMDLQKKISRCFSLGKEDFASPFPLEEGKIAGLKPINIIIYPQVELEKKPPSDIGL